MRIDAHLHLWNKQNGRVNGKPVVALGGGCSDFGGEIRQMQPPYMLDGSNTAEMLLANMDFAGVSACVVTQEEIDGNQDDYLISVRTRWPDRFRVCSLYTEGSVLRTQGFDGVKLCAGRFRERDLTRHFPVFQAIAQAGLFLSVDLADGDEQTGSLREILEELPTLRVAVGHFGMVTRPNWKEQIRLARDFPNVVIESGGITWLFHSEFYPYPSAVQAIREAAEICGIEKLLWGSDYPRTMTAITYRMSFDFVEKSTLLSPLEKAAFLGENARRFYGFSVRKEPEPILSMVD